MVLWVDNGTGIAGGQDERFCSSDQTEETMMEHICHDERPVPVEQCPACWSERVMQDERYVIRYRDVDTNAAIEEEIVGVPEAYQRHIDLLMVPGLWEQAKAGIMTVTRVEVTR